MDKLIYFLNISFLIVIYVNSLFSEMTSNIKLTPIAVNLENPVDITSAGDGSERLFVVEQTGLIRMIKDGLIHQTPFLNIKDKVISGGELGLLGLAFHPEFKKNGRFFVDYTTKENRQLKTVVAEYRVTSSNPDVASREKKIILEVTQPFSNHNGGQVRFGPDGYLYIALGDGGGAGDPYKNGQNNEAFLGKILRIDVNRKSYGKPYSIPPDNPFVKKPGADEIWAYGLRNPWRFSFDRQTGRLFAADVGQNDWEEVDIIIKGGNYGWNIMEGNHCFPPRLKNCNQTGLTPPIAEYDRSEGISVTGGFVYRGRKIPSLNGKYIFGDYGSSRIWTLTETKPNHWKRELLLTAPEPISSFGEDDQGEIYVAGYNGTIFLFNKVE